MVTELEKIMDSGESGLGHNLVKFQAIERQNSILVVASKPELLRTASLWISRLDKSSVASTGVKVYRVKYGDAKQMAALLMQYVYGRRVYGPRVRRQSDRAQRRGDDLKHGGSADRRAKTGNAERETGRRRRQPAVRAPTLQRRISTAGTLGPLARRRPGGAGGAPLPCASRPMSPTIRFSFTPARKITGSLSAL